MTSKKDLNENVTASFQIPLGLKEKTEQAARDLGISFSPFVRKSLHLCANFCSAFWPTLENLAWINGISEHELIERILFRYVEEIRLQSKEFVDLDALLNEPK